MSEVQERAYQDEAETGIREAIRQGFRRILLVIPTGGGKTTIMSKIIQKAVARERRVLVVAHRKELIDQAHSRLNKFGVSAGKIMGAKHKYKGAAVNVGSIQTLSRRDLPEDVNLAFIDEAHHAASGGYVDLQEAYQNTVFIGLTATPRRLDGKPLGEHFDVLIEVVSPKELIAMGFLVQPRYFGAPLINTDGVKKSMGDFNTKQLFENANKKTLYAGVVKYWQRWAAGLKTVAFCVNVEHSQKTVAEFQDNGISAAHLDAETPEKEREALLSAFFQGHIMVLSNVGILTEGYDLPDIGCVLLNRATDSESLYLQMGGRGLRPAKGKSACVIIDFGENIVRHGFLEDDREWSLQGKKKTNGLAPVKYCRAELESIGGECGYLNAASARFCEDCGQPFTFEEAKVEEVEFVEIIPPHLQKLTRDLSTTELSELSKIKGYKPGWGVRQLKERATFEGELDPKKFEASLREFGAAQGYKRGWVERVLTQEFYN